MKIQLTKEQMKKAISDSEATIKHIRKEMDEHEKCLLDYELRIGKEQLLINRLKEIIAN